MDALRHQLQSKQDRSQSSWKPTYPLTLRKDPYAYAEKIVTVQDRYLVAVHESRPDSLAKQIFVIQYLDKVTMKWHDVCEFADETDSNHPFGWRLFAHGNTTNIALVIPVYVSNGNINDPANQYVYVWTCDIFADSVEVHKLNIPWKSHLFGTTGKSIIWMKPFRYGYILIRSFCFTHIRNNIWIQLRAIPRFRSRLQTAHPAIFAGKMSQRARHGSIY